MLNLNFEAMEQKIEDILRRYDLKEWQIEDLKKDIFNLHSVMISLPTDEEISIQAKRKYPYQKTKGGTYYEGKSKGYAEGANWMKFQIEKLNEA